MRKEQNKKKSTPKSKRKKLKVNEEPLRDLDPKTDEAKGGVYAIGRIEPRFPRP